MTATISADTQFQEHVLEGVEVHEDGYTLKFDGCMCLGCPKIEGLPDPQVGETLRSYGRGFGSTVRGIVIGGRVYRYLTEAQQQAEHQRWCDDLAAKREREFNEKRDETDKRIEALPEVFRARIYKFQHDGGMKFRHEYEPYELFCCEQAVVIADALKTVEAITAWKELPWGVQKTQVPGLDDGHSGNTFGMACALARVYIEHSEFVAKLHGALTPLVGCDDYGCQHPNPQEQR